MVVRDRDILLESRYINFEKKCMAVVPVTTRMVLYLNYDKLRIINICTTIYGMCINSILFYTNITCHSHGVQRLTPSTYTLCQAC